MLAGTLREREREGKGAAKRHQQSNSEYEGLRVTVQAQARGAWSMVQAQAHMAPSPLVEGALEWAENTSLIRMGRYTWRDLSPLRPGIALGEDPRQKTMRDLTDITQRDPGMDRCTRRQRPFFFTGQ